MRSGRKTDHSRTFIIQRADNAPKNPKIRDVVEGNPKFPKINNQFSNTFKTCVNTKIIVYVFGDLIPFQNPLKQNPMPSAKTPGKRHK